MSPKESYFSACEKNTEKKKRCLKTCRYFGESQLHPLIPYTVMPVKTCRSQGWRCTVGYLFKENYNQNPTGSQMAWATSLCICHHFLHHVEARQPQLSLPALKGNKVSFCWKTWILSRKTAYLTMPMGLLCWATDPKRVLKHERSCFCSSLSCGLHVKPIEMDWASSSSQQVKHLLHWPQAWSC